MAQAITEAFPDVQVQCHDLLEDVPPWLQRSYPRTYYLLVRYCSWLWGIGFELLDRQPVYAIVQPLRQLWNTCMARRFIQKLRATPPDLLIATHFFPADVVSACQHAGWLRTPLVVVITDLHPHRFWLSPSAAAYICGTAEGARVAERRGVPSTRLHVLGIPIAKAFAAPFNRVALLKQFGLQSQRQTILITSGGSTVGPFQAVVEALIKLEQVMPNALQLLVVCGDDQRAARRLQQRASSSLMPIRVFGFIHNMPEAMAVSDLLVTKAGGLTVSEALGQEIPLLLYHTIPGQERMNAQYVERHGAAMVAQSPRQVAKIVHRLFKNPERLAAMSQAAKGLSHPHAAETIVSDVIAPLLERR